MPPQLSNAVAPQADGAAWNDSFGYVGGDFTKVGGMPQATLRARMTTVDTHLAMA